MSNVRIIAALGGAGVAGLLLASAPGMRPTYDRIDVHERLYGEPDLEHYFQISKPLPEPQQTISRAPSAEPNYIDSAPIRARLLDILGAPPSTDIFDDAPVELPRWCVDRVMAHTGLNRPQAQRLIDAALVASATREGAMVVESIEHEPSSAIDFRSRRLCATELFYALPGDEQ